MRTESRALAAGSVCLSCQGTDNGVWDTPNGVWEHLLETNRFCSCQALMWGLGRFEDCFFCPAKSL